MSNELAVNSVLPAALQAQSALATEDALSTVEAGGGYLPYIQLMAGTSKAVVEGTHQMGHLILQKGKTPTDLGKGFDCLCLAWRPRAMQYGDEVTSIFDTTSPEFSRIKDAAVSGAQGYAFGMEFLLFLPDHNEFALYFFGNKTSRIEAPNMKVILDKQANEGSYIVARITSELTGKKNRYNVPVVNVSESALTQLPDETLLGTVLESFNNPPKPQSETVEADERDR